MPLYNEMDNGGPVCQNMLEFEPGEMFGFQMKTYACRITILISNNIKISRNVGHLGRFLYRRIGNKSSNCYRVMGRVERGNFTLTLSQNRA